MFFPGDVPKIPKDCSCRGLVISAVRCVMLMEYIASRRFVAESFLPGHLMVLQSALQRFLFILAPGVYARRLGRDQRAAWKALEHFLVANKFPLQLYNLRLLECSCPLPMTRLFFAGEAFHPRWSGYMQGEILTWWFNISRNVFFLVWWTWSAFEANFWSFAKRSFCLWRRFIGCHSALLRPSRAEQKGVQSCHILFEILVCLLESLKIFESFGNLALWVARGTKWVLEWPGQVHSLSFQPFLKWPTQREVWAGGHLHWQHLLDTGGRCCDWASPLVIFVGEDFSAPKLPPRSGKLEDYHKKTQGHSQNVIICTFWDVLRHAKSLMCKSLRAHFLHLGIPKWHTIYGWSFARTAHWAGELGARWTSQARKAWGSVCGGRIGVLSA